MEERVQNIPDTEKAASLEDKFKELDAIAARLENRDISLEESFRAYKRGMELLKECDGMIEQVEKKMLQISKEGELIEF